MSSEERKSGCEDTNSGSRNCCFRAVTAGSWEGMSDNNPSVFSLFVIFLP